MDNAASAPLTTGARNKMAATYGAILGVVYVVFTTLAYMMIANMITFYVITALSFVVSIVLIGVFIKLIRKANGGYLEFREAFGSAFVMVLIALFISNVYNLLYMYAIDPDVVVKMKESTLRMMENMKTPDEALDQTAEQFDKQIEKAKKIEVGAAVLQYFGSVLVASLFAIIPCAIVKKARPIFDNA